MMSSGIGRLKSRPGRVYAKDEKIDIPDVSVYQLGDQTGHHAKLFVWVSVLHVGTSKPVLTQALGSKTLTLRCAVLCCAVLCCAVLCCAVLCCACAMLCCSACTTCQYPQS
jgi:hypothetical protein